MLPADRRKALADSGLPKGERRMVESKPEKLWMMARSEATKAFRETILHELLKGLPFPQTIVAELMQGGLVHEEIATEVREGILNDFAQLVRKQSQSNAQEKLTTHAANAITNTKQAIWQLEARYVEFTKDINGLSLIHRDVRGSEEVRQRTLESMPEEYRGIFSDRGLEEKLKVTQDCLAHVTAEIYASTITLAEIMKTVKPEEIVRKAMRLGK